jgi:hypothetical protein
MDGTAYRKKKLSAIRFQLSASRLSVFAVFG